MTIPKIVITVLGEFSIRVDGELITRCSTRLSKVWEAFIILAMTMKRPLLNEDFMKYLWDDDVSTNPQNALKNVIYCLRRDLCEGTSIDPSIILFSGGQYRLSDAFDLHIDAIELAELYRSASLQSDEQRKNTYKNIISLYSTGFILKPSIYKYAVNWVDELKSYFTHTCLDLCDIYYNDGDYQEIITLCNNVAKIEPYNQAIYTYLFKALDALGRYDVIINEFHQVNKLLLIEHIDELNAEIKALFKKACANINPIEQDIVLIRAEIRAGINSSDVSKKAYYCSYEVFKHMCNIKARDAARLNKQNALILVTISDPLGNVPDETTAEVTMEDVKKVIASSLRKGDVFAKYSNNQYVLMMTADSIETLNTAVMGRINSRFANTVKNSNVRLSSLILPL